MTLKQQVHRPFVLGAPRIVGEKLRFLPKILFLDRIEVVPGRMSEPSTQFPFSVPYKIQSAHALAMDALFSLVDSLWEQEGDFHNVVQSEHTGSL